jgi:hypothetical protein
VYIVVNQKVIRCSASARRDTSVRTFQNIFKQMYVLRDSCVMEEGGMAADSMYSSCSQSRSGIIFGALLRNCLIFELVCPVQSHTWVLLLAFTYYARKVIQTKYKTRPPVIFKPLQDFYWGMRHTSTALYFYGASKITLYKPRVTFGNMLFKISYSLDYYLHLLC